MSFPFLFPSQTNALPLKLSLPQFMQTVLVGISGLDGTLVRPSWQQSPPKQPDIAIDWLAFAIESLRADANAFLGSNPDQAMITQRHEVFEVPCSAYGPNALETYGLIRDGLEIPQNRASLIQAKMGYIEISQSLHAPDLVNERWFDRYRFVLTFRREIQRTYPVLSFTSALGVIHTVLGNEQYLLDWATPN